MGRKNRRDQRDSRPLALGSRRWTESGRTGEWTVSHIRGNDKTYVCPGCHQEIAAGVSHVVAWREDGIWGVNNRAHWHAPCWQRGAHRR